MMSFTNYIPPSKRRYGGLTEEQLEAALRSLQVLVERGDVEGVFALELLVRHLDEGRSLAEVMDAESGYRVGVRGPRRRRGANATGDEVIELRVGCFPGPLCGDEGTWRCTFDGCGKLVAAELSGYVIS